MATVIHRNKEIATNEIVAEITRIYSDAQAARGSKSPHFEKSIDQVLQECHDDRRGRLPKDEIEIADELAHLGLEFGKRKAISAMDIMKDVLRHSIDQPILEPTDEPELTDEATNEILVQVKEKLYLEGFVGDLKSELIKPIKAEVLAKKKEVAQKRAYLAEKKLRDRLEQMEYDNEMDKVVDDFVSMPYAVVKYPSYEYKEVPYWSGNSWKLKHELVARAKRVSPFDIYLVGGDNAFNSAAVIEVIRCHVSELEAMKSEDNWRTSEIEEIISTSVGRSIGPALPSKNREYGNTYTSASKDYVEFIEFVGKLPRRLFDKSGMKIDGNSDFIEITAVVCENRLLYIKQQKANSAQFRPYYISSYEKLNGSYAGIGVLQRVHKASRIARSMVYANVRNAAFTSRPTGEWDIGRMTEFYPQEDLQKLGAGQLYFASPDITGKQGGHSPALTLWNIPNYSAQFQNLVTFYMDLIDMLSMVPKIGSGDMRGMATLGRSFRGIAMVQAAESKSTKAALDNFDRDIQEPLFLAMYNEEMADPKNADIRGDIRVKTRGTSGYTVKEAQASARQEALQYLAPYAQQIPPEILQDMLKAVMTDSGIDTEKYFKQLPPVVEGMGEGEVEPTTSPGFGGENIPI